MQMMGCNPVGCLVCISTLTDQAVARRSFFGRMVLPRLSTVIILDGRRDEYDQQMYSYLLMHSIQYFILDRIH